MNYIKIIASILLLFAHLQFCPMEDPEFSSAQLSPPDSSSSSSETALKTYSVSMPSDLERMENVPSTGTVDAARVVRIVMGKDHVQAAQVLQDRFNKKEKKGALSLTDDIPTTKKGRLAVEACEAKTRILSILAQNEDNDSVQNPEILHLLSEAVIKELMEERQHVIKMEKSSSLWKKINGCLAAGVSVLSIIQWGIVIYQQIMSAAADSSDCSCLTTQ